MEHELLAPQETDLPQEVGPLAHWIRDELGDDELAQFLEEHPEGLELCMNGESILPRTVFELVHDLRDVSPVSAKTVVEAADASGLLPKFSNNRTISNIQNDDRDMLTLRHRWQVGNERLSLGDGEEEKTRGELLMIEHANFAIDRLRERFGLAPTRVPPEAVRFLDVAPREGGRVLGTFDQVDQESTIRFDEHPLQKLATTIHELVHHKSYGAIRVDRDAQGRLIEGTYRTGMNIYSRDGDKRYLTGLNEAVTEETANRLVNEIPDDHPVFGDLAQKHHRMIKYYVEEHPEMLRSSGQKPYWFVPSKIETPDGPALRMTTFYSDERVHMSELFDKLIDRNPERFQGKTRDEAHEELFTMLQKAMFTGNILPFGRLFNATFGHGKFREYGHLQTVAEQNDFLAQYA